MSTAILRTAAGAQMQIIAGKITMPLLGAWQAHLELGETSAPTGAVTIELAREGSPPVLWQGFVDHGDTWQGRQKIVVRAGSGGLAQKLDRREYLAGAAAVPAAQLVGDVVRLVGEVLADPAQAALTGLGFARWDRPAGDPASRAVGRVARRLGLGWRVLDAGTIWMGPETWPAVDDRLVSLIEDRDGDFLADKCAPDAAILRPGTTVSGRQIYRVTYTIGEGAPRAELLYRSDRSDLSDAIRSVSTPDPLALVYEARVATQHADGTLDLALDEPLLPELRGVRYRSMSGMAETFAGGESVLVAFLAGREDGAIAWGCAQDTLATHALALVGDACSSLLLSPGAQALSVVPAGTPLSIPLAITGPGHKRAKGESA